MMARQLRCFRCTTIFLAMCVSVPHLFSWNALPLTMAIPITEDTDGECNDVSPNCVKWATDGECERSPEYMAKACSSACTGKLPQVAGGENKNCEYWAADGQCESNPAFMAVACRMSCEKRRAGQSSTKKPSIDWPETAQNEEDIEPERLSISGCVDDRQDCAQLARANLSGCGEADMMLTSCRQTCGTCAFQATISGLNECVDKNANCAAWKKTGECERNPRFMNLDCAKACGVCHKQRSGCVRRNSTAGVAAPDGMAAMFQRALTSFPQHTPTALSTHPHVLQFENLVSAEEAQEIIARTEGKLFRSPAGDEKASPVRTSTQYWCEDADGCAGDAAVQALTRRMANITQLPEEHAEFMQILRYEPGQFFKVHHDQQTAHWTPQGVRVYTFFVYLSEVEAGGGTKFQDLGVTVRPKVGRGVLWPNVIAEDLRSGEPGTRHEALPVEKGIKYGANLWFHLYDFRGPSRAGACPFIGMNTHLESASRRRPRR